MRFSARILGFLLAFFLTIFVTKATFAQTNYHPSQNAQIQQDLTPNTDPNVPNNLHYFTQGLMLEIMSALSCQITGIDPIDPAQQCLNSNPATGKLGFSNNGGAIGAVATMIGGLYVVPIRVGDYVAYLSNNFGVAKQTYAQGIGFYSLSPMVGLWTGLRNVSYLLFVIIFLVVGFAIMLRVNIDARTVMTIQNQIPKLIIGIVLITFSYAIAGLLVDTMWVANYVIVDSLTPYTGLDATTTLNQTTAIAPLFVNYVFGNPGTFGINFGGIIGVATGAANGIGDFIGDLFSPSPGNQKVYSNSPGSSGNDCHDLFCNIANMITAGIGALIAAVVGGIVAWIVRIMGYLIIGIAILWALIRLWIALIKAYVFVLIDVVLAPFWIVAGLIPGAGAGVGFSAWIKDLLGNLMAFPATIALFMLGRVIFYNFKNAAVIAGAPGGTTAFSPPLIGSTLTTGGLGSLMALGIILMSPSIVNETKKFFKSTGGLSFSGGENLKAGQAIVGGFIGGAASNYFRRDQYGRPVGAGATFLTEHFSNPVTRNLLGWRYSHELTNTEEVMRTARARNAAGGKAPKNLVRRTPPDEGGTTAPPAAAPPA